MNKKTRTFVVLFFVLANNISAMEQDPKTLVFDLIVPFLSYRDQMNCIVSLNQNWQRCALDMCTRKKALLPSFPDQCEPLARLVHKHGDECFYAYRDWGLFGTGALALHYFKLSDDNKLHEHKPQFFENFISPLPHNPMPFIEDGKWYFYGCGEVQFHHYPEPENITTMHEVIRYCLNGSLVRCAVKFGNTAKHSMRPFINRPGLLAALLNSTIQNIRRDPFPPCLEFSLEGASVPPNFPDADSFDDLSAEVKDMLMRWCGSKIP